jgi:hypothetical protein
MPEKSGTDVALCGPPAGTGVCPKAGVTATVANVANKSKSHRGAFMLPSVTNLHHPHGPRRLLLGKAAAVADKVYHLQLPKRP